MAELTVKIIYLDQDDQEITSDNRVVPDHYGMDGFKNDIKDEIAKKLREGSAPRGVKQINLIGFRDQNRISIEGIYGEKFNRDLLT